MVSICKATEYNWRKLKSDTCGKLTKRANKTLSVKRVVASSYLNYPPANELLSVVLALSESNENIIYSLCIAYLKHKGIFDKEQVQCFFSTIPAYNYVDIKLPLGLWDSGEDVIGFVYQSLMTEGERNLTGQYYTNKKIVEYILEGKTLEDGETFLDPCCGSGAFLMSVKTNTPACLYGFDINPVAVMVAGTNLLVKYSKYNFIPNVYCLDFLLNNYSLDRMGNRIPSSFDNIYTNPPWGTDKEGEYARLYPNITSKERSSMVILHSLERLSTNGNLYFLLPMSLLKIKTHRDIRKYMLSNSTIIKIDLYDDRFDGVFTNFFSIKLEKSIPLIQEYDVIKDSEIVKIKLSDSERSEGTISLEQLTHIDDSIMRKLESRRHDDLKHSQWALGIVTGDNKTKVKKDRGDGLEPVYVGKEVSPFILKNGTSYILFEPNEFQQCAKEEFYRAPEKLIYRFIAKYPIVAYDNQQCLCLNSANIVIPELDGVSIKSAAALLNSKLYHYYYSIKFPDIKVLKGNLQELPFPKLSIEENEKLENLVTSIQFSIFSDEHQRELDKIVYSIFDITPIEQMRIQARLK